MDDIILDDGTKIKIIFNFKNNNETFIIYKEINNEQIFASKYHEDGEEIVLDEINSEDEWELVENKYQEYLGAKHE